MRRSLHNFARNARRNMTAAEERLWHHLRTDIALQKTHFRRQVVLKTYIADFCCHASRLIIEVDGETHSTDHEIRKDEKRTQDLNASGYRVLRFTNDDVLTSIESVIDTIYVALQETPDVISEVERVRNRKGKIEYKALNNTPTPYPSPQGGGEYKNDSARPATPYLYPQGGVGKDTKEKSPNKNDSELADRTSSFPSPLEGEGQGGG